MWVIKQRAYDDGSGRRSYEVGYYVPGGAITTLWIGIKECDSLDEAMDLAHYLNGGNK